MGDDIEYGQLIYKRGDSVEIYNGRMRSTNQEVCIKVLWFDEISKANEILQESYNMIRFKDQENIVKIFKNDLGQGGSRHFVRVIMEFFRKGDLNSLIKNRINQGKYWMEDELIIHLKKLVAAFAYLQEKNFAHRDIKPENIFIKDNDELVIGDLGSAKEKVDNSMTIVGTPLYLSPEVRNAYINQLQGKSIKLSYDAFRSDVYSLGLTFLYMASLQSIVELSTPTNLVENTNARIRMLTQYPLLREILFYMLAFDNEARPDFKGLNLYLNGAQINSNNRFIACYHCKRDSSQSNIKIGNKNLCIMCCNDLNYLLFNQNHIVRAQCCSQEYINDIICGKCTVPKCNYCKNYHCPQISCIIRQKSLTPQVVISCPECGNFAPCIGYWIYCETGHVVCVVCNQGRGYCHVRCSLIFGNPLQ